MWLIAKFISESSIMAEVGAYEVCIEKKVAWTKFEIERSKMGCFCTSLFLNMVQMDLIACF